MLCTGLKWLLVILHAHIKYSHVLLYNSLYWQSVKHHQCPWIDAWRSLRPFASHTVQWVIEWVLYKPCEKKLSGFQNFVIRRQHEIYRGVHAVAVTATVGWLFMETYLIIWWHQAQSGHRSRPVTVCNCKCDCNCIIIIRPRRSRNAAIKLSRGRSVGLSVHRSVCPVHCGKTVDWIRMPFGITGRTGPGMRHVVGFGDRCTVRGTFGGEFGARSRL